MSEKPESDEFEEDEDEVPVSDGADVDLDQVNKELDLAKRRGQKLGDSAWTGWVKHWQSRDALN